MELDLWERGVDYRDFYKPGGGPSRLTLRRLLLIVEDLPMFGSRFWAAYRGDDYVPQDLVVQSDIFSLFSDKPHYLRTWREDVRRAMEKEKKKQAILRGARERARRLALK